MKIRRKHLMFLIIIMFITFIDVVYAEDTLKLCERSGTLKVFSFIGSAINVAKILLPFIIITYCSRDIVKAVISGEPTSLKEAMASFGRRLASSLVVLLLPSMIYISLSAVNLRDRYSEVESEFSDCNKCILGKDDCKDRILAAELDEEARAELEKEQRSAGSTNTPPPLKIGDNSGNSSNASDASIDDMIYQLMMVGIVVSSPQNYKDTKYGAVLLASGSNWNSDFSAVGSNNSVQPLIATDDEGGKVSRAAKGFKGAREYGGDSTNIANDEAQKTKLLLQHGITMNLSPVADAVSKGALYDRSYSDKTSVVKVMISKVAEGRNSVSENGLKLSSVLKHYPGYSNSDDNTDNKVVTDSRQESDINTNIEVFDYGINNAGYNAVMMSNIIYSNLDNVPASFSSKIIGKLRKSHPNILIMTDDISSAVGASSSVPNDRCAKAIIAGCDMVVLNENYANECFTSIKNAVSNKSISENQLKTSYNRIISFKKHYNLRT